MKCMNCINTFCASLPSEIREEMCRVAVQSKHNAKEFFVKSVGPNGYLYILSLGTVIPYRLASNGNEIGVDCLHAGSILGLCDFLNGNADQITVYAKTNIELCAISVIKFDRLRSRCPAINDSIIKMLGVRLKHSYIKLGYTLGDSIEKMLYQLDELFEQQDVSINFTHDELALLTGMNRVTVSRVIESLKQRNIIKPLGRGRFVYINSLDQEFGGPSFKKINRKESLTLVLK